MTRTSEPVPKHAVRGGASGGLYMAFFGTLWVGIGSMGLPGWGGRWIALVAVLGGIGLLVGGLALLRSARRLPAQATPGDDQHGKEIGRWFGMLFAAAGVLIAGASGMCNALNRFDVFFPIMACIVGVHFLPLAALFRVQPDYGVGTALCLHATGTLLVVPHHAVLSGQSINLQLVGLGVGATFMLWMVGVGRWMLVAEQGCLDNPDAVPPAAPTVPSTNVNSLLLFRSPCQPIKASASHEVAAESSASQSGFDAKGVAHVGADATAAKVSWFAAAPVSQAF